MMLVRRLLSAKILCVLLMGVLGLACSKSETIYTKEQMLQMSPKEGADKVELVLARDINDSIPCSHSRDGCLSVHRLRTHNLDFIAVEFDTSAHALSSAKRVHGWTTHNWLFDDVEGEPTLMRWLERVYQGQRYEPLKNAGTGEGSLKTPSESALPSPSTK